jgi:hypothetical protein
MGADLTVAPTTAELEEHFGCPMCPEFKRCRYSLRFCRWPTTAELEENFSCPMCREFTTGKTDVLSCGHLCCHSCFREWRKTCTAVTCTGRSSGTTCPHCRKAVDRPNVRACDLASYGPQLEQLRPASVQTLLLRLAPLLSSLPAPTPSYHVSSANLGALPEIAVTHPPDTFCARCMAEHNV